MKKQIYNLMKCLLAVIVIVGSLSSLMAQNAKVVTFDERAGYFVTKMSTNGRFVALGCGHSDAENDSYVWDRTTGEYMHIGLGMTSEDVSNDGIVVGTFEDPEIVVNGHKVRSGGWCENGVWHGLGGHPDHPVNKLGDGCGSVTAAISADGQYIGGFVYISGSKLVPAVWKRNNSGGYTFHKAYNVTPNSLQGGRVWDISDDGQVICGWDSSRENESWWTPTMWTDSDKMIKPKGMEDTRGTLWGMNPEGTIAVGDLGPLGGEGGILLHSDGTHQIISMGLQCISSDGLGVGYGFWKKEFGVLSVAQYCEIFWNTDVSVSGNIRSISGDGKHVAACVLPGGIPFTISFEGDIVATPPLNVNAKFDRAANTIALAWSKPYYNGETLLGYNVYKGEKKLNTELMTGLTFMDTDLAVEVSCYSVEAVYQYKSGMKSSVKTEPCCVEVIAPDGCFSPKKFEAEVIYNKTVNLRWGVPGANFSSHAMRSGESTKLTPSYLKTYTLNDEIYPASDGNMILAVDREGSISTYFKNGESDRDLQFEGQLFGGITFDDVAFYSTLSTPSNGISYRFKLDFPKYIYQIEQTFESTVKHEKNRITYIPTLDSNNGGFEIGNANESWFYKKDLVTEIGTGLKNISKVCGTAYYDGKIYASIQEVDSFIIKVYDATTGEETGEYIDLSDYGQIQFFEGKSSLGGLTVFKSTEGVKCLAVVISNYIPDDKVYRANKLVFLQIEESKELLGYNLYRNGTKYNASTIIENSFSEDINTPGDYTYHVTALFGGGCESAKSLPIDITITPIGTCNSPMTVNAEVIRNDVHVTWKRPQATAPNKLVGYNLYRNGKKLNTVLIKEDFLTDRDLELGEYTYEIEAFYDNSCISPKSEQVTAKVHGYNNVTPPTNLSVKVENAIQAKLEWNEPALGDYKTLTWHNGGIELKIGENEKEFLYVGAKWDGEDLAQYFDYTLTDIEFYATANVPHIFYIYVDGEVVAEQELQDVTANAFNLLRFDTPVLIEKGKELLVGYRVPGGEGLRPVGADKNWVNSGKGDLISYDGKTWESLYDAQGFDATWAITIRLTPYTLASTRDKVAPVLKSCEKGTIAISINDVKSETRSLFKNTEVMGYNIYKDGKKMNNTLVKTESYLATIDNTSNSCFEVEAVFTRDRISPKTSQECIYGECKVATDINGKAVTPNDVILAWTAPTGEKAENITLQYYDESSVGTSVSFTRDFNFYALIQSTVVEHKEYSNLKLKSVEALVVNDCNMSLVIMENGKIVLESDVSDQIKPGELNTFEVPYGGYDVDLTKNILIGFRVNSKANVATIATDNGPAVSYRGDVILLEGKDLSTITIMSYYMITSNWCIAANFEQIAQTDEEVLGYNVYRDGTKINTDVISTPMYNDKTTVENTDYEYYITTLWNTGCESKASASKIINTKQDGVDGVDVSDISIFPNPAKNRINIRGEYNAFKIYNSTGVVVLEQNTNSDYINVESLKEGMYILELSNNSCVVTRTKIIIK